MFMEWREDLSVGVQWMDSQHQELVKRLNRLYEAMKKGQGQNEIKELVDFLQKYTVEHFHKEEQAMIAYKYSQYEVHREEHQFFVRKLKALQKKINEEGVSLSLTLKVQNWMKGWLLKHIQETDRDLGEFFIGSKEVV